MRINQLHWRLFGVVRTTIPSTKTGISQARAVIVEYTACKRMARTAMQKIFRSLKEQQEENAQHHEWMLTMVEKNANDTHTLDGIACARSDNVAPD